jgi:ComF family protein
MALLVKLHESFLNLLFPRQCVLCSAEGAWACPECIKSVVFLGDCQPVCSLFSFDQPLIRALLHALKYEGVYETAESLISIAQMSISPKEMKELLFLEQSPMLVPVPTSRAHQSKRGYVQTIFLVKALSRWLGIPYCEEILSRKEGETQVGKTRQEREAAIAGAFSWKEIGEAASGRQLILVDDTYTTGATFSAAKDILQPHSPYPVRGLVMARVL